MADIESLPELPTVLSEIPNVRRDVSPQLVNPFRSRVVINRDLPETNLDETWYEDDE